MIPELLRLVESVAKSGMIVAEIGVWQGESTLTYLPLIKQMSGHLFAVDTFSGNPTAFGSHAFNPDTKAKVRKGFLDCIESIGCADTVTLLEMESHIAPDFLKPLTFDLVFLDADHRYSWIKRDIAAWWPMVKCGGILAGHDLDLKYSDCPAHTNEDCEQDTFKGVHLGVAKALSESGYSVNMHKNTCWSIVKPV